MDARGFVIFSVASRTHKSVHKRTHDFHVSRGGIRTRVARVQRRTSNATFVVGNTAAAFVTPQGSVKRVAPVVLFFCVTFVLRRLLTTVTPHRVELCRSFVRSFVAVVAVKSNVHCVQRSSRSHQRHCRSDAYLAQQTTAGRAMDLLVPCIVEGRSELRDGGRVNCKTHWPISGC